MAARARVTRPWLRAFLAAAAVFATLAARAPASATAGPAADRDETRAAGTRGRTAVHASHARAGIDSATWVDHDARPIHQPAKRKRSLYGLLFREAIVEPISHTFDIPDKILWLLGPFGAESKQHAANANAFDEVPNSTWFTNRNHVRALSARQIRDGAFGAIHPEKPWTVTELKKEGFNPGFHIKDANGKKWLIKLDPPGYPQAGSGAGVVSGRLLWAAGFNISHDDAVTFRREDLHLESNLAKLPPGDPPVTESELQAVLDRGAHGSDGRYHAGASLFLPGKPIGPINLRGKRPEDPNDWYTHKNRRELRGLYVVYSWINNWDVKDQQSLETFETPHDEKLGHVTHYLLDVNGSLGAAAEGAKPLAYGYEQRIDPAWTGKRLVSLGFAVEPWRRARQESGIPSVGNFESEVFEPNKWSPIQYVGPFREMTDGDAYWGAKLVASFSNSQIAAAIDAAGYEDPRAPAYLLRVLAERRDKIARFWFDRVAPLDFFHVEGNTLRFHDLALDLGLTGPRAYVVDTIFSSGGATVFDETHLRSTDLPLPAAGSSGLSLRMSIEGSHAKPVRVDLARRGSRWVIFRVRHG